MKPLTPTTPHVIIMVGIPGSGKSTFAEHFAKTFQAPIINQLDISRVTELDSAKTAQIVDIMLDELLKTNRTLIYEGSSASRKGRQDIVKRVVSAGYRPLLVWVQTESAESKRRATKGRNGLSIDEFNSALKHFTPPSVNEKAVVISGRHTYATQLKVVLKHLASQQRPEVEPAARPRPVRNVILR